MKKDLKLIAITLFISFVVGLVVGELDGKDRASANLFTAGYDAAMNHVRTTIEAKTPDLAPFYMADLGIMFIPQSGNILTMKFVGSSDHWNGLNGSNGACPRQGMNILARGGQR
jgi:hypothetical protein